MINLIKKFIFLKINKLHEVYKITNNNIIFDIGAHKGDKSKKLINFFSKIVLVEPQPECVKILKSKFSKYKNIIIVETGVSSREQSLELKINSSNPLISTFSDKWTKGRFKESKWDQKLNITTTTLDKLVNQFGNPDFIKIDVEGHEYDVVKGLSKKVGTISFEFTSEFFEESLKCLNYLQKLGYEKFNYSEGERRKFNTDWVKKEKLVSILKKELEKNSLLWGDIYTK
tara:strand:- start:665 stop:1351 length:687 start_codon:yes stop_codon:yes gene_type:complete